MQSDIIWPWDIRSPKAPKRDVRTTGELVFEASVRTYRLVDQRFEVLDDMKRPVIGEFQCIELGYFYYQNNYNGKDMRGSVNLLIERLNGGRCRRKGIWWTEDGRFVAKPVSEWHREVIRLV